MIKIFLPQQVGGKNLDIEATTISDVLTCVDKRLDSRFVNIFVNGNDIRFLDGKETLLKDGDEVSFIPAIAGGL